MADTLPGIDELAQSMIQRQGTAPATQQGVVGGGGGATQAPQLVQRVQPGLYQIAPEAEQVLDQIAANLPAIGTSEELIADMISRAVEMFERLQAARQEQAASQEAQFQEGAQQAGRQDLRNISFPEQPDTSPIGLTR